MPARSLPRVGERPAVDVAPALENAEHAVELAGEALAATPDAPLEARGLALEPFDRGRRSDPRVALRVLGDRVGRHRFLGFAHVVARPATAGAADPDAPQRLDCGAPKRGAARRVRLRELDVADRPRAARRSPSGPSRTSVRASFERQDPGRAVPARLLGQHDDPAAAPADDEHVAGAERVERARATPRPAPRSRRAAASADDEPPVLLDVAVLALRRLPLAAEQLLGAAQLAFQRDDVTVGPELRERQVQEVVGGGGRVAAGPG